MSRFERVVAATVTGAFVLAGVVISAPQASAAPAARSVHLNGYSWNGYKAVVKPTGFKAPSGSVIVSKKVSAKGHNAASQVRLSPGSHRVKSTFTYRSKTAYRATRSGTSQVDGADSCTVTGVTPPAEEFGENTYDLECTGTDDDDRTGTFTGSDTAYSDYAVGEDYPYAILIDGTIRWTERYTANRYGKLKKKTVSRTVVVSRVRNTPVMTRAEWYAFGLGDSLAWVRKVTGSRGRMGYDDGNSFLGTQWIFRNSSGGNTYVWVFDGAVTSNSWYS